MYKLVIIDDKPNVIDGIQRFGDWVARGIEVVGAASNGLEALDLIETTRPDIAITDIAMPLMNGLDFTAEAHKILPRLKIIVLSGYDQFDYAQQALRLGVVDYLLKPVKIDQIIAAVIRARDTLEAENTTTGELQALRRHTQRSTWSLELDGLLDQPTNWQTLCETNTPAALARLGLSEWPTDMRLVLFVPTELLPAFEQAWLQTLFPDRLLVTKEHYGITLVGEAELGRIAQNWVEGSSNPYILLSPSIDKPGDLPHLYHALLDSLKLVEFNHLEPGRRLLFPEMLKVAEMTYPLAVEHEITRCLQVGLTGVIPALVNKFYRMAGSGASGLLDPAEARVFGLRLLTECSQVLGRQGDEGQWLTLYGLPTAENRTRLELEAYLSNFISEQGRLVAEQRREKTKSAVERAIEFIRSNLHREISLDDVASELHFTPSYLANQFKKTTGETVVEYIGRLKMERAAELVCDPATKIASIAQALGYNDRRYFSELFRRKYGCTPSEYREKFWLTKGQV